MRGRRTFGSGGRRRRKYPTLAGVQLKLGYAFNEGLNSFARKYLLTGVALTPEEVRNGPGRAREAFEAVCAQLMFHDGLAVDVHGENLPASVLLKWFGFRGLEELLEAGAIEFVLNSSPLMVVHKPPMGGAHPLAQGRFGDPVHSDPEASATEGLSPSMLPVPPRKMAALARKVADAYRSVPEAATADAIQLANSAHREGLLTEFGLTADRSPMKFDDRERELFGALAGDLRRVAILAAAGYEATTSPRLYSLTRAEVERVAKMAAVERAAGTVFTIESLPAFDRLVRSGKLKAADIPRLRNTEAARHFRTWLRNLKEPTDALSVSTEYVKSIGRTRTWEPLDLAVTEPRRSWRAVSFSAAFAMANAQGVVRPPSRCGPPARVIAMA